MFTLYPSSETRNGDVTEWIKCFKWDIIDIMKLMQIDDKPKITILFCKTSKPPSSFIVWSVRKIKIKVNQLRVTLGTIKYL